MDAVAVNGCNRLLVVDDNELNRDMLARQLGKEGYDITLVENGHEALCLLQTNTFDLILLDLMMPGISGYDVLKKINTNKELLDLPVLMLSAFDETETTVQCIEAGAVDYLTKPYNPVLLKTKVASCLERKALRDEQKKLLATIEEQNRLLEKGVESQVLKLMTTENQNELLEKKIQAQLIELNASQLTAIFAMSKLAESRDPDTGEHLERVREYCTLISKELKKTKQYSSVIDDQFINNIYTASPLHDIGKVGIPDSILLKKDGLTPDEWEIMKTHSTIGAETLRAVAKQHPNNTFIRAGIDIAESHHEKWDGSGYPHGQKEQDIPLVARIVALSDVYDALTSRRCYKEAYSHQESCEIIVSEKRKHFDPAIVDIFVAVNDQFHNIRTAYQDSVHGSE